MPEHLECEEAAAQKLRFEKALASNQPAVWDWEPARNSLLASLRFRKLLGFGVQDQLSIQDFRAAIEPMDHPKVFSDVSAFVVGQDIRLRVRRADRKVKWVQADIHALNSPGDPHSIIAYSGRLTDITEQVDSFHALIESEERLRLAVEAGKMAVWENDLETGTVTPSPDLNLMFGFPADAKPSLAELRSRYAPGELERIGTVGATWETVKDRIERGELKPRVLGDGPESTDRTQVQVEFTIVVPPGVTKHLLYRAQYVYSLEGRPKITGFLVDITDKRRVEDQLAVIARELRHRVKNSLAVVQALAYHSFTRDADAATALQTFLGRIQALSLANDVILKTESAADLRDVIETITKPFRTPEKTPFVLNGPTIPLDGKTISALSMVLHELCTNALKYGALSQPTGRVYLDWRTMTGQSFAIDWRERGGPEVLPPTRKGFGTRLLNRIVAGQLGGSLDFRFEPVGLSCGIQVGHLRQ